MTVFIDADGCPVVDITVGLCAAAGVECIIVCNTSHVFEKPPAKTITVGKGNDSADFALVNMLVRGDVVITQDYGLAAMCLARGAVCVSQNGLAYTGDNIDGLLMQRHTSKKMRAAGGRTKGPAKRTARQDEDFKQMLEKILNPFQNSC